MNIFSLAQAKYNKCTTHALLYMYYTACLYNDVSSIFESVITGMRSSKDCNDSEATETSLQSMFVM